MSEEGMAADIKQEENLRKQRESLERALDTAFRTDDEGEKKDAQKALPELKRQSERYADQGSRVVSRADLDEVEENLKAKRKNMIKVAKEIRHFRPPVNFELMRDMRKAVDEKKKQLASENWEEHLSVLEDAIEHHDLELAAAALTRATEYGNENEVINMFGYDSGATGLKEFIDENL